MIDTLRIDYTKPLEEKERILIEQYLVKINELEENKYKMVIKSNRNDTSTLKEILKIKDWIDSLLKEKGAIMRVDLAFDSLDKLEENKQLYRAFLCCLSIIRYKNIEVYNTDNFIKKGNMKIQKHNYATTIYNCEDKLNRIANTRVENRALYIRDNLEDKEKILKEIERYNQELKEIIQRLEEKTTLLDMIDKFVIPLYLDYYNTTQTKFVSIAEFIAYLDRLGFVFTKNTLEILLKKLGYKSKVSNFIREFRRIRGKESLKFVTKKALLDLVKEILKENKKTVVS